MSRRSWDRRDGRLAVGLSLVLLASQSLAEGAGAESLVELSADAKLKAVVEAAWTTGPDLTERITFLQVEAADNRSSKGAGTPYLEYQQEGIGPSFENRPNAQQNLRLGTPFNLPWQITKASRLEKGLQTWQTNAAQAARLRVASFVAGAWLRLAGVEERIVVEETRLERMDRAVSLQSARFELGEVAGMDVMQLELQRAGDLSTLRVLQSERRALQARIFQLAGKEAPLPAPGDLQSLTERAPSLGSQAEKNDVEATVERGIVFRSLGNHAEKERLLSELVGSTTWGRPEIQVEWEHIPTIAHQPGFDAFGFRIAIPLPLGEQGGERAAAARAQAEAAAAGLERARRELISRAEAASAAAQFAPLRLEETEPFLERLPKTEFSLSEQFRLGAITYLVYIDGLARLDELRLQRIDAYETYLQARLELEAILGDPIFIPPLPDDSAIAQEVK